MKMILCKILLTTVYSKEKRDEKVIIIWVDDLIIAASNEKVLKDVQVQVDLFIHVL